jgi:hypothetical protein
MNLRLLTGRARTYRIALLGLLSLALLGVASAANLPIILYDGALGTRPEQQSNTYRALNGVNPLAAVKVTQALAQGTLTRQQAANAPIILYDGALGTRPDQQSFMYRAINGVNPLAGAQATQTLTDSATILDTTPQKNDLAGYALTNATSALPVLNRTHGYTISFTLQIEQETHTSNDRAGFSVIALSSDKKGIEVAFWKDQIWVQNDGAAEPPNGTLFTHGEGVAFDTTRLISYTLSIAGDSYSLASGGATILHGQVRDYTAWEAPLGAPNPYRTPNLLVLSDDSTSSSARIKLAFVAAAARQALYLPLLQR